MMRRLAMIALACCCLVTTCAVAGADDEEMRKIYLDRYRGPYRGQVVDAETKAPLAGAVVVALWRRHRIVPLAALNERYAVREVVTDAEGRFVIEAKDIEEHAPRRTIRPEFCIFQPGYGSFPRRFTAPKGLLSGIFEGTGAVIELPRLSSRRQRLEILHAVDPYGFSEQPFTEVRRLTDLFNQEGRALGLKPYEPQGRHD